MINCAYCNKEFKPRHRGKNEIQTKYCSRPCYFASRKQTEKQNKTVAHCAKCGKTFARWPSQIVDGNNYCSKSCANSANGTRANATKKKYYPKIEKQCKHCQKPFYVFPYRSREAEFCTRHCFYEYRVKQTAGNYKGDRADIKPSFFRKFIKKCAICGFDIVVDLHHIVPKSKGGADTFDNLIPLCPNHHAMADRDLISRGDLLLLNSKMELNADSKFEGRALVAPQSESQPQSHQLALLEHSNT